MRSSRKPRRVRRTCLDVTVELLMSSTGKRVCLRCVINVSDLNPDQNELDYIYLFYLFININKISASFGDISALDIMEKDFTLCFSKMSWILLYIFIYIKKNYLPKTFLITAILLYNTPNCSIMNNSFIHIYIKSYQLINS